MSRLRLFVENFLVYGLGGIISKIIPLIMLPIITRLMPNSSFFGLFDLSNTVTQFASAIAIMGMYDAMYRMFFEKEEHDYKKSVCSTALIFTIFTSLVVFIIMLILKNQISELFFGDSKYTILVYLTAMATLVGATNSIISAPTRMQNKRKIFLVTNTVSPVLSYSIAIPLLFNGYYVIALPLAGIIAGFSMEVSFWVLNKTWFALRLFDKSLLKQMLVIAIPLLPNFMIYWLFNSCDKIMITNIIGLGAAGVYSVGSKLGHASQLIYTAFAGGWQYFAFSTMKEKDQVKMNSSVFEYLGVISFSATVLICAVSAFLFELLFEKEYYQGYIIAPYLFLAPLLQMLFQVIANQFLVIKKTWPNMVILLIGAIINIMLNLWLIPIIGIEGAAIATLCGYLVSNIVCIVVLLRMKLMILSKRFVCSFLLMSSYVLIWRMLFSDRMVIGFAMALVIIILFCYLYRSELRILKGSIKHKK